MSDSPAAFNNPFEDYSKSAIDFFSFHSPADILAPHPDLFESDLDSSLAALDTSQLQLLTVDSIDAYQFLRADTPTCRVPSSFTVSSESAYDSLSSHSESFYNPPSTYSSSNYSFPLDLEMEFQKFRVDALSDYQPSTTVDPNSFGTLPPTPPRSPEPSTKKVYAARPTFSDYTPGSRDYYLYDPTVAPSKLSSLLPSSPPMSHGSEETEDDGSDPRKKYKCPTCTRAFARAYNLKTHMATHDPNRLKPYVCSHRSCGRSFSRKHDLARHQISLHGAQKNEAAAKKSIGVAKATRSWCDNCGRGWVGKAGDCNCEAATT